MKKLPPYLFAEIDKKRKKLIAEGKEVISFGVGDPDLPTPERIVNAMRKAVGDPSVHRYPFGKGRLIFVRQLLIITKSILLFHLTQKQKFVF